MLGMIASGAAIAVLVVRVMTQMFAGFAPSWPRTALAVLWCAVLAGLAIVPVIWLGSAYLSSVGSLLLTLMAGGQILVLSLTLRHPERGPIGLWLASIVYMSSAVVGGLAWLGCWALIEAWQAPR